MYKVKAQVLYHDYPGYNPKRNVPVLILSEYNCAYFSYIINYLVIYASMLLYKLSEIVWY